MTKSLIRNVHIVLAIGCIGLAEFGAAGASHAADPTPATPIKTATPNNPPKAPPGDGLTTVRKRGGLEEVMPTCEGKPPCPTWCKVSGSGKSCVPNS